jgi:GNAT superfamily N-acetyltransferase
MTMNASQAPNVRPHDIDRVVNAFVHGFAFTRSFTHPYVAQRVGPVWVLQDAPRTSGDYRRDEWVAHGVPPAEVDRVARRTSRGWWCVSYIHPVGEDDAPLRAAFKSLGYRLGTTEPVMCHDLARIPRCDAPATIQRVTTQAMADALAKLARSRQILPEHLGAADAPLRQYVALDDAGAIVGWVRSIAASEEARWCSNMYVLPKHRRRGIGRAMLSRMLRDDRAAGATTAVLTASHTGAKLYTTVGYEQIGTLYLFTPRKR